MHVDTSMTTQNKIDHLHNYEEKADLLTKWAIPFVATCLVGLVAIYLFYFGRNGPATDPEKFGQFGDYIGGILNPVLGFFSLLVLLTTIRIQAQELRNSTDELRKSADALSMQNDAIRRQTFESTFFSLLSQYREIVSSSFVAYGTREDRKEYHGSTAFKRQASNIIKSLKQKGREAYRELYLEKQHILGPYFRTLYHIYKFIDRSTLSEHEKIEYANIVRAQLCDYELALLFYNGISEFGVGFKPLIIKYRLLKHLDPNDLVEYKDMATESFYPTETFLGREE